MRFPDWALWNLPLMAHEFGHLAIGELPLVGAWLREESLDLLEQIPNWKGLDKDQRKALLQSFINQLEEVFADIFALYTIGPCFALAFIVCQFSPAEAYLDRGDHPPEAERLTALLRALQKMDDDQETPAFAGVYTALKSAIDQALQAASTQPEPDFVEREDRAVRWGEKLYDEVDRYFRLGARYSAPRWKAAQKAADLLLEGTPFPFSKLDRIVTCYSIDGFFLPDLLNALWWARRRPGLSAGDLQRLTASGFEVARRYFV
jgi:hypothetical protein